jgi:hypothetical protein
MFDYLLLVIPVKAGIHLPFTDAGKKKKVDSRLRGNDD